LRFVINHSAKPANKGTASHDGGRQGVRRWKVLMAAVSGRATDHLRTLEAE
jgi:hypothetical protein